MIFLSIAHAVVCIIVTILAIITLKKQGSSILSLTTVGFIVLDSISLAYLPYFDLSNIPYLDNPDFLINDLNSDRYSSQVFSHWLFLLIASLLLLAQYRSHYTKLSNDGVFKHLAMNILFIFGILFTIRYMLLGPGLEILLTTQISFSSTTDAIAARSLLREKIENGQGAYLASLSSKIIFPLFAAFIISSKNKYKYAWWGICCILSLVYAIQTREKAPIILAIILYALIFLWHTLSKKSKQLIGISQVFKIVLITSTIFFLSGTAIYSVNFGLTPAIAIQSILLRTLAVPAATETNFFETFPKDFQYRGLQKIFKMPLAPNSTDVSIYEVATSATGKTFASNASIVAVAWSGYGYIGIIVVSLMLFISIYYLDLYLGLRNGNFHLLAMLLSIPSLLGLTSGGFADYTTWGGILLPLMIILTTEETTYSERSI